MKGKGKTVNNKWELRVYEHKLITKKNEKEKNEHNWKKAKEIKKTQKSKRIMKKKNSTNGEHKLIKKKR